MAAPPDGGLRLAADTIAPIARDMAEAAPPPATDVHVWGLSARKRAIVGHFLPGARLHFPTDAASVPAGASIALWGSAPLPERLASGVNVLRMEDGFLRSVGLGADLVRPLSWVVDGSGIYYDARHPSDLEALLARGIEDRPLLARAAALRREIVRARVTKYNVGRRRWARPSGTRRVVLVTGQVESDASLAEGGAAVRTNLGLLQATRAAAPDAFVVYKPHPDVLAGLRGAGRGEEAAMRWCDDCVTDVEMGALLDAVDEVHVMTSLAGFEALLRGKSVTTHGMPFYAGWGLTHDLGLSDEVAARRRRRLTIEELVAATLILYPRYVDPIGRPSTPEAVLQALQRAREGGVELPWWRRVMRPALAWAARRRGTY